MKKFLTALFLNLCFIALSMFLGWCLCKKTGNVVAFCTLFMAIPSYVFTNIISDFDKLRQYRKLLRKRSIKRRRQSKLV